MNLSPNEKKFDFANYRRGRLSRVHFWTINWAFFNRNGRKSQVSQITKLHLIQDHIQAQP